MNKGQEMREIILKNSSEEPRRDVDAMLVLWHIHRIARHVEYRFENEVHRPQGWNWTAFRIMVNIAFVGPMEPSELADVLEMSRASVTVAINQLEGKGLVVRGASPVSKRNKLISLTPSGEMAVAQGRPGQRAIELETLDAIGDEELATLSRSVQALYDNIVR